MTDVCSVVDTLGKPFDGVQILREIVPRPFDAGFHRPWRDVLCPLEVPHYQELVFLGAWREGEAAVAHHDRRDAVPARAGAKGIPENLRVHVSMPVDKAGGDDVAFGFNDMLRRGANFSNREDAAVLYADVGSIAGQSRPIDNGPVAND